ncbi:uncharacterized protein LOC135213690 [Macrobrachium nipponense]|uniref:uncharacterized protein LOC135213690 n=1 Tax=Macrobrachium nipponense TaxID=159736 RepID=UPI0030C7DA1B
MNPYARSLLTCFAIVLLGFTPATVTFIILRFFPSVISSESVSAIVLIDFACACWSLIVGDKKRRSLWPREPASTIDQDVEAAAAVTPAVEDKPPEYEKVIEKAPPYESVLMEDAYKNRTMNSSLVANTTMSLDRFEKKDAAIQKSDPDLPTYEEAARLVCKPVE